MTHFQAARFPVQRPDQRLHRGPEPGIAIVQHDLQLAAQDGGEQQIGQHTTDQLDIPSPTSTIRRIAHLLC
ncbi:hypothetical protein ACIBEJ_30220 [Nonomuraea sp. NPDC050790]|uniref:hypothetical protein n=1 Tax=Nonomuraea sp. NPDC050790 TaxID=3364371 RepID=UPI0037B3217D